MNPIDVIAQAIRTADGNHQMGAGRLAEAVAGVMASPDRGERVMATLESRAYALELDAERRELDRALRDLEQSTAAIRAALAGGRALLAGSGTQVVTDAAQVARRVAAVAALGRVATLVRE